MRCCPNVDEGEARWATSDAPAFPLALEGLLRMMTPNTFQGAHRQAQLTGANNREALASVWASYVIWNSYALTTESRKERPNRVPQGAQVVGCFWGKMACSLTDQHLNVYALTAQNRWRMSRGGVLETCLQTTKFIKLKSKSNYWLKRWYSFFKSKTCSVQNSFLPWVLHFGAQCALIFWARATM